MPNPKYEEYLRSLAWHQLKKQAWIRCGGICEIPGCCTPASELHHLTYVRIYNESLDDLLYICWLHHRRIHMRRPFTYIYAPSRKHDTMTVKEQLDLFCGIANDNNPKRERTG